MTVSVASDGDVQFCRLDRENGAPVFDRSGRRIAVLKYLLCDAQNRLARYAVLSSDGFLGPGDDCRPVPAILLSRSQNRPGYALNIEAEKYLGGPRHLEDDGSAHEDWWSEADGYYADDIARAAAAHRPRVVRS